MLVIKQARWHILLSGAVSLLSLFLVASLGLPSALAAPTSKNTQDATKKTESNAELSRWWNITGENAQGHVNVDPVTGTEKLYIYFSPNEALCRDRYGDNWYEICDRRTGMMGRLAMGADGEQPTLQPAVAGEWRWQTDTMLAFVPEKAWPADTEFRVIIPTSVLPEGVKLLSQAAFVSKPVSARMEGDFKFDPQKLNEKTTGNTANMVISGTIAFPYPMDKESVLERISLVAEEGKNGKALLGKPEWEWGPTRADLLFFSVPVLQLPDQATTVGLVLAAGSMATSGGRGGERQELTVALPGKSELFRLTGAEALMMEAPNLGAKQTLALQFSLPIAPSQAVKDLEVLLLPRQRVENGDKTRPPYRWWSKSELTPEVLQRTEVVKCVPTNSEPPTMLVSLNFASELEAGRSLVVKIPSGLKSASGYTMSEESSFLVQIPAPMQDLRIMQNGAVLALPGEKTLSLYSRNLDTISYEVIQVRPEYINQLATQRGDFSSPYIYSLSLDELGAVSRGEIPLVLHNAESPQFSSLDLAPMLKNGQKGFFIVDLNGSRQQAVVSSDRRFVLVTDIGLIRKQAGDGSSQVFTVSLSTGKPIKGAFVRVLGANGLPVFQAESDGQGQVHIPDLDSLKLEKKPTVLLASVGDDVSFLPLNDPTREVNYYGHDVGTNVGGNLHAYDGLTGWTFGQRGVYRPGETAHVGYVVKHGDWTKENTLKGLPLRVSVYDPRGNVFARNDITLSADGFGDLDYALPETAATGKYTLDLQLMTEADNAANTSSPVLASSSFRVEEFQPDTMKLTVRLEPAVSNGWLYVNAQDANADKSDIKAQLELANLFGTPAAERRVTARMTSLPTEFAFRDYADWTFYDAAPNTRALGEDLLESITDAQGKASFVLPPAFYRNSSVGLEVMAEGFDAAGGRSVQAKASMLVSPLPWVLGWKTGSNLDYLRQNSEASLELLALSPNLQPLDPGQLTLETVAVSYIKSLIRDEQGQYRYDMARQETVESSRPLSLPATGATFKLDLSRPGEWLLLIRNAKGEVAARIPYVVAGNSAAAYGEDRNPVLGARLDKGDYTPGAEMEIFLSTPYAGTGLITVERDKVESFVWFNAEAGSTVQRLRLPKNFEGKAYVNVLYFRALDDKDIFTKPLAVAVLPFTVNMESRDVHLSLKPVPQADAPLAADSGLFVARPGTLKVELKAEKPCRAVVFAVDEGILQLSSYSTPQPLQALLGDRALEVITSQYFDLLMPEYSLMSRALSAFGGGEGINFTALGQNAFRRPGEKLATYWSGIFELNGSTVLDIPTPPSFSGRLRIMAVAVSETQTGSARTDVLVRPDVIIQPSLPLFAAPGDEFEAVVAVTDMSGLPPSPGKNGREVLFSATTDGGLEVLDFAPQTLVLQGEREQRVVLRLRALNQPGGATLTVHIAAMPDNGAVNAAGTMTAEQNAKQTVSRPVGMSIRPASPRSTQAMLGRAMQSDGAFHADVPFARKLYPQHAALSASMSAVPLPVAHALFRYVASYPFACTEQVVSGAFPALFMLRYPPFAPQGEEFSPEILRQRVLSALATIQSRLFDSGELSMWPGGYAGDFFLAVYAADFLTAAEETGVSVDVRTKTRLINYLNLMASATPTSMAEARMNAYAAWVLTRNGVLTSNILATLTAWLETYQTDWRNDITSVFMAGCWRLMMENTEARKLLDSYKPQDAKNASTHEQAWLNALTTRSLYLSVVAGQFPEKLTSAESQTVVAQVLDLAATGYYDTVSAAQASRALLAYSAAQQAAQQSGSLTLQAFDAQGNELAVAPAQHDAVLQATLQSGDSPDSATMLPLLASLRFRSAAPFYWQVESTGYDSVLPTAAETKGMEVRREFVNGEGKPVTKFRQGDEVLVRIHARSYGKSLTNVAIVDLLPGCFEMVMSQGGNIVSTASANATENSLGKPLAVMRVEHVERREDRLLLFPALDVQETTYTYRVRVTSRGTFVLPPLTANAMYDPRVAAHSAAAKIVVE